MKAKILAIVFAIAALALLGTTLALRGHPLGYRGRMAIFEIMLLTAKIRELIFNAATSTEIRSAAISQGMSALYLDGLRKTMDGLTTIEEVYRVAKRTEQDDMTLLQ